MWKQSTPTRHKWCSDYCARHFTVIHDKQKDKEKRLKLKRKQNRVLIGLYQTRGVRWFKLNHPESFKRLKKLKII